MHLLKEQVAPDSTFKPTVSPVPGGHDNSGYKHPGFSSTSSIGPTSMGCCGKLDRMTSKVKTILVSNGVRDEIISEAYDTMWLAISECCPGKSKPPGTSPVGGGSSVLTRP